MRKIRCSAALLTACILWGQATPPADPQKAANERRDYIKAHYTKHEFLIPMRDGLRLFTSVYAPKSEGEKYPLLITRTPYTVAPYGDDTFVVVEKWESAAHLKAHAKAAHTLEYQATVKDLIESRTIHVLSPA